MIPRHLRDALVASAGPFPVVFLTGPRQAGKTTLARAAFPDWRYVSLEDLAVRQEAVEDPRGFLARFQGAEGVVFDEAQRAPDLFSYLQGFIDAQRAGPVVLTGSQHFLLSDTINQTLAGRAAIVELLPFASAELRGASPLSMDGLFATGSASESRDDLDDTLLTGFYPPIHDRGIPPAQWHEAYIRTYIERDVRTLTNVGNLDIFRRFLALCAGRSGQLLNMSALGADAGVDQSTARRWLSLLRASYILDLVQPYHRNFRKRLVKTPKLYFNDTGVVCGLLGIRNVEQLRSHPLRGAIFETFVFAELKKLFANQAQRPPLFFWRDARGHEVDFLVETGGDLAAVEVKSGQTVSSDFFDGLDRFAKIAGEIPGLLVYGGDETYDRRGHRVCSWRRL